MLGTIVNCLAVIIGGTVGVLMKKGIPDKIGEGIMNGLALCVMYIGISGTLDGENVLIAILSIVMGTLIGEALDLDNKLTNFSDKLEKRLSKNGGGQISQGFVAASLLFCVGAMAIVGSLQSGISGNHETLFAKSLIDGISAIVLSSTLGVGVILSSAAVLIYQGAITVCASFLEPVLTQAVISEMTCVGSMLIVGISLNMLKITKLKLMNFVPSVFMPIIIYQIIYLFK